MFANVEQSTVWREEDEEEWLLILLCKECKSSVKEQKEWQDKECCIGERETMERSVWLVKE